MTTEVIYMKPTGVLLYVYAMSDTEYPYLFGMCIILGVICLVANTPAASRTLRNAGWGYQTLFKFG